MEYPGIPVGNNRRVAKTYVKYHYYLDDSSREIFKDGSKSLSEYSKMRAMVVTALVNSVRAGRLLFPGEENAFTARVATEYGKKYTRSMLKALWQNEKNGECFSDFDEANMFASESGRAKFQGVMRMNHSGVQAKKNYDSAHSILTKIYSKGGDIPEDIAHLLRLIKNYPAKAALYHMHSSLVPLSKRQASYFKMYEQLMYKMDAYSRGEILLRLPYGADWKKIIKGNRLLRRIHDNKPKIYEIPDSPEQQNHQPTFEEQLERKKKRKRDESSKISTYLRHRTAHRMDDLQKEQHFGYEGADYEAEDSELVALAHFPMSHPRLQEELFGSGQLQGLKFEELF